MLISVVVAQTGLFCLAFALFGVLPHKWDGGKPGKSQPKQPGRGSFSTTKKTFHPCSTPGVNLAFRARTHLFDYDMNTCGLCLTLPPSFQQCCAIRLFPWNCEPQSLPLPVLTVDKGVTRLALQLGSVELSRHWLANWTLVYLDHRAPCQPLSFLSLQDQVLWLVG